MKKIISFITLLALLVSGCSQEEILQNVTPVSGEGRTFTTSFEQNESRTYLEDGRLSRWTEGDRISLFDANTLNSQYLFAGDTGDSSGTFFLLNKPEGTGSSLAANYAVYPYSEDVAMTKEGEISVTLPTEQHYAENSYGLGDNTMVAVTEDTDDTFLKFKNVGGAIKLQLYGDDLTVKSITLMGNNDEKIAGKASLMVAYDAAPVVNMANDATTSITLDCGENGVKIGATADEATAFWMVIPPVTFEKGFTIAVKDIENKMFIQTIDKEVVIARNVVSPIAAIKVEPQNPKIAYSEDEAELEGWAAGLFAGEGTYIMGKPHGDNGYLMTIGNILDKQSAIVFMDESKQVREIFLDNTIITLGENTNGAIDVSIVEKGGVETLEHLLVNVNSLQSRSSGDHSQQIGIINLLMNMEGMYEAMEEIIKAKNFSKKGVAMFLLNKSDGIRNTVLALGGPDIFNETFSTWLGYGMNAVTLVELFAGISNPVGVCVLSYFGLYTTYLDLYDEHIEKYYGNSIVSIESIDYQNNTFNIELKVSGYELYNIECGVIVRYLESPLFKRWSSPVGIDTRTVTQNGSYSLSVGSIELDESYLCEPFLISKSRDSLWKGFIGDFVGPLVRYGKAISYKTPSPFGTIVSLEERKRNSATLKCEFSNVESGVECGIIIKGEDGYNNIQSAASTEGEQTIILSGLDPLTEYTCIPYVRFTKWQGGLYYKEGNSVTFKTLPPDISGTWTCTEGSDTYTLMLNQDGSATCSLYDDIATGSWSMSEDGVVTIGIMTIATNTFNSGVRWTGPVDDVKNPQKIVGSTYNWNFNQNGYYAGDSRKMIMTR